MTETESGISIAEVPVDYAEEEAYSARVEALLAPVEDAGTAEAVDAAYAEAAGAVLGSVERISDSSPSYAPLFRLEAASMDMAGNSSVTYRAGDVTARAEVSITYTLN